MQTRKYLLLIFFIGFLLYFTSFFNNFLWDDEEFIVNNPTVRSVKNIPGFFFGKSSANSAYYRPIMSSVYSFLFVASGGKPLLFRLFQVGIHLINTGLIFLLFSEFFQFKKSLPFFLALIFLVHPANVEAVSFISAAQEVLFFLFGMIGLLLLIKGKRDLNGLFLASILFFLSLLTKETGIIFLAIAVVYIYNHNKKDLLNFTVINIIFIFIYFLNRLLLGTTYVQGQGLFPIMRVSFLQRLLTVPKITFFYLEKFFFPLKLAIAQHWVVLSPDLKNFYLPLFIDLVFFLLAVFVVVRKKNKLFNFFFFWFIISLLPHLQIIPLNMTVAERWFYLPMVGLLGMIGVVVEEEFYRIPRSLVMILIGTVLVLLFSRTIIRNQNWKNELTLFSHDGKEKNISFDLENNLGVALFRSGNADQAEIHIKRSTELAPYWWVNWNNLGAIYERKGDFEKAESFYKKSLERGNYYLAYENYTGILIRQKKYQEAKEFLEKKGLIILPNNEKLNLFYRYLLQI